MISYKPLLDYLYENGITKKDLIEKIGLSSRTVTKFQRNGESVSLATIEKICNHYRIPIYQVVEIILEDEAPESD